MAKLRFAVIGAGFWAQFQLAGWLEVGGVEPVAIYNRSVAKAEAIAERFGIPAVYSDVEMLFEREELDFVDIITDVGTHAKFVHMAADVGLPVVCQKPMATSLEEAHSMVARCDEAGVPFIIHENWRWQTPIRELAAVLDSGRLGRIFKARIEFANSFPVFSNQPFLAELNQFILTDIGSHILDTARFLFGEAQSLYCRTSRVNQAIKGEDVATVVMEMIARHPEADATGPAIVTCDMSYASRTERERFPQTFISVECERGSVELTTDYWLRVTDESGTHSRRCPPPRYPWADPAYDVVHSSIVGCNADVLRSLTTGSHAETSGHDNLRTVELVFRSYESAASGRVIALNRDDSRRGREGI